MKWMKRCGAALLAAALVLSGCGAAPQPGGADAAPLQAKGRFVETEFQVTDGAHTAENGMLYQTPSGALVVLQTMAEAPGRWDSDDGGQTWRYTDLPWAAECEPLQRQTNLAVEEDGSLLVSTNEPALYRVSPAGEVTPLPMKELEGFASPTQVGEGVLHGSVDTLIALADGGFFMNVSGYYMSEQYAYLSTKDGASTGIYNADGTRRKVLPTPSFGRVIPAGKELLILDWEEDTVTRYDAAGEKKESRSLPGDLDSQQTAADAQGNLYFFTSRGVQRLAAGSNVLETILDGETYSFGTPVMTIQETVALDAEHLILGLMDQMGAGRFYHYTYDPEAPVGESSTLRVWALEDSDALRLAVSAFRRRHPAVKVQLDLALASGGVTAEDAVRTLNTELLAGKGPDVLILDGTPAESFAKNGLLADLTPYVDAKALYEPFRKPFETENGMFCLPALFHLGVLAGRAEDLDAVTGPAALARLVAEGPAAWDAAEGANYTASLPEDRRPAAFFEDLDSLFDLLWNTGAPALLTPDGVDAAALEAFLTACKQISDHWNLTGGRENEFSMGFGTSTLFYKVPNELTCYMADTAQIGAAQVQDLLTLDYPVQFHFGADGLPIADGDTQMRLFPGFAPGAYQPVLLAGISASGAQQELAGAFVNTLLGPDVQAQAMPTGMPTTKAGVAAQIAQQNEKYEDQMESIPEGAAHGRYMADPERLIAGLTQPVLTPRAVKETVRDAVGGYCAGSAALEDTLAAVQAAIDLYLAEQA